MRGNEINTARDKKSNYDWMLADKLILWVNDSPMMEERANLGISTSRGQLFYILFKDT